MKSLMQLKTWEKGAETMIQVVNFLNNISGIASFTMRGEDFKESFDDDDRV